MIRKVIKEKKCIMVVPYVSIVQEKTRWLKKVLGGARVEVVGTDGKRKGWREVRVVGFHSGTKQRVGWDGLDVAVCTTEKVGDPGL